MRVTMSLLMPLSYCRTHLQDLKDVTEEYHYENYRANYIQSADNNNVTNKASNYSEQTTQGETVEQLLNEKDEEVGSMLVWVTRTLSVVIVYNGYSYLLHVRSLVGQTKLLEFTFISA